MCLGTVGVISALRDEDGVPMALVDTGAAAVPACLLTCPQAGVGDSVLIHCGYVLRILDAQEEEEEES
ncbi:HypC/HybG/HupF family hydrogenase formation chaperone [Trebonia sp.]|uniref:HypC/HybG/HupF family hydrogenase formation chaperone n=1 Tax=Trebonia sp. TaxID=2767075 RepID=UPI0026347A1E|nr:HypC/HybG/HupF family hydrogenase formation chaperone [Trebonia sp.]